MKKMGRKRSIYDDWSGNYDVSITKEMTPDKSLYDKNYENDGVLKVQFCLMQISPRSSTNPISVIGLYNVDTKWLASTFFNYSIRRLPILWNLKIF